MNQVTLFGALALSFMMVMYTLERRHRLFIIAFAFGCLLSSAYGFLSGAWPFGVVEVVWSGVAIVRFLSRSRLPPPAERLIGLPEEARALLRSTLNSEDKVRLAL